MATQSAWHTFVTICPKWFLYSFDIRFNGPHAPDTVDPFAVARARVYEMQASPALLQMSKAKLTEALRWQADWKRRHPLASQAAADKMALLVAEGDQVPNCELQVNFKPGPAGGLLLVQFYDILTGDHANPVAVFDTVVIPTMMHPTSLRLDNARPEFGQHVLDSLLPNCPILQSNPVIAFVDFLPDLEANALAMFMGAVERDDRTRMGSDIPSESSDQSFQADDVEEVGDDEGACPDVDGAEVVDLNGLD
jgi:hypothetical protein